MLCWAAGGPQSYSGRAMDESHRHLLITAGEWQAFMDDVQQTLDKFGAGGGAGGDQGARRQHAERDRGGVTRGAC
jgi:hypothetical protein